MSGVLITFSMGHTQINPIGGRPFLTSMVALENFARYSNDDIFKRIHKIARLCNL